MSSASGRTSYDSSLSESEDLFQTFPSEQEESLVYIIEARLADRLRTLRELSSARSPNVTAFLRSTTSAIVEASSRLPPREQAWFGSPPSYDSILGSSCIKIENPALCMVQTCIAQHAQLIRYADSHTSELFGKKRRAALSFGPGMLTAATLTSCRSMNELLRTSCEMAMLSFRLGINAASIMDDLDSSSLPWTLRVNSSSPFEVRERLDAYNNDHPKPVHHRVHLNEASEDCVQVTGLPSNLKSFLERHPELENAQLETAPPFIPWSTPFMKSLDINQVLGTSTVFESLAQSNACFLAQGAERLANCVTIRDILKYILCHSACRPATSRPNNETLSRFLDTQFVKVVPLEVSSAASCGRNDLKSGLEGTSGHTSEKLDERSDLEQRDLDSFAVVGMALRCPGADSLEDFWTLLMHGREMHQQIPLDRFDVSTHYDPEEKKGNTTSSQWGCFIDQLSLFDHRLFNISPREAAQIDPAQRLILLAVHESLDNAGYYRDRTPAGHHKRIGTFFGVTGDDYREANSGQKIDFAYVTGGVRAFGPGRVNHHFKFDGPSYSVDTACSASAASIQLAIASLKAGDCDTAIAGGANVLTASDMFAGLSRGNFLSPTGSCKTFLEAADGYCRAEAVACVVIKRLGDALSDNDKIQAVITACATNHSSRATSIVQPHRESQEALFREVLTKAKLRSTDIDFIEMHGTGTQIGDATEAASVHTVFLSDRDVADRQLHLGSIKPNFGHAEAASGVCSLIKAILMLKNSYIPPVPNVEQKLNPKLPPSVAHAIPRQAMPFLGVRRRLLVNNFGASGGNTSMIVEDAPCVCSKQKDPRSHSVVTISGKTNESLKNNVLRLLKFIKLRPELKHEDLGYTTTARRQHYPLRRAFSISCIADAVDSLSSSVASLEQLAVPKAPKLIFTFEGQGNFFPGMALDLLKVSPVFSSSLARSDRICRSLGLPSFIAVFEGITDQADSLQNQLALAALEIAIFDLWTSWGLKPDCVVGHSLGEYAALYASGVLSLSDMFFSLGRRGQLLQRHCTAYSHSMISVNIAEDDCQALIDESGISSCEMSCYNGASTVVSGPIDSITHLALYSKNAGLTTSSLKVPYAFHSSQMDVILEELDKATKAIRLSPVNIPFASSVTGDVFAPGDSIPNSYLNDQCRKPVNFGKAAKSLLRTVKAENEPLWLGIGPSSACLSMVESALQIPRSHLLPCLSKREPGWKSIARALASLYQAGLDVDWPAHHRDFERCLTLIELPTYAFDLSKHWIKYEGDWMVRKGQTRGSLTARSSLRPSEALHRVISQDIRADTASVTLATDLLQPPMRELIHGHRVNGNALCSSTVYAEMAYAAATSVSEMQNPNQTAPAFSLENMSILRPFILDANATDVAMHTTARSDPGSTRLKIEFESLQGSRRVNHGHCVAATGNAADWQMIWRRTSHLVRSRIDAMSQEHGSLQAADRLSRSMIYKLFGSLVEYSAKYQGLEEVFLKSDAYEAVGRVSTQNAILEDAHFLQSPYWLDPILHISGFALNASTSKSTDVVYIAHGWKSLKISKRLAGNETYHCYVRMFPHEKQGHETMSGDVYAFEGDKVVAVGEGISFQALKRSILHQALPKPGTPTEYLDMPAERTTTSCISEATRSTGDRGQSPRQPKTFAKLVQLISKEIGVSPEELETSMSFADLGIDSLLSLSLLDSLAKAGFANIPKNAFTEHMVVSDLRTYFETSPNGTEANNGFEIEQQSHQGDHKQIDGASGNGTTLASEKIWRSADTEPSSLLDKPNDRPTSSFLQLHNSLKEVSHPQPRSTECEKHDGPVLLQNSSFPAVQSITLFLLPDGSGLAASYAGLVPFGGATRVYGLNAPDASDFGLSATDTVESRAANFTRQIRAIQPKGPYTLGGWSVGGSYAFECARELLKDGEQVAQLILIDAPCFSTVPQMSRREIDVLSALGVFGGGGAPPALLAAFESTINALRSYVPKPLPSRSPGLQATAIWARKGVLETCREQNDAAAVAALADSLTDSWVLRPRCASGRERQGWAELLPGVRHIDADGDHFSMMRAPHVGQVGAAIHAALDASVQL